MSAGRPTLHEFLQVRKPDNGSTAVHKRNQDNDSGLVRIRLMVEGALIGESEENVLPPPTLDERTAPTERS